MKPILSLILFLAIAATAAAQSQTIALRLPDKTYATVEVPSTAKIENTSTELRFVMPNATLSLSKNKIQKWFRATPQFLQDSISPDAPSIRYSPTTITFTNPKQQTYPIILNSQNRIVKHYTEALKSLPFTFSDYKPNRYRINFNSYIDPYVTIP